MEDGIEQLQQLQVGPTNVNFMTFSQSSHVLLQSSISIFFCLLSSSSINYNTVNRCLQCLNGYFFTDQGNYRRIDDSFSAEQLYGEVLQVFFIIVQL